MTLQSALNALRRTCRVFACTRGNIAMMFGLAALPLAMMAGFGIDVWRQNVALTGAQDTVDAAALAAASTDIDDEAALKRIVDEYLAANLKPGQFRPGYATRLEYADGARLTVHLAAETPAFFTGLIGRDSMPVNVEATAVRGTEGFVEVALVLDNTWSMSASDGAGSTKIDGLKAAASALITELMVHEDGKVRIAVAPYADYVNVGTAHRSASWIDVPADRTETSPRQCEMRTTRRTCTGGVWGQCPTSQDGVSGTTGCWTTPQVCTTETVAPYEECWGGHETTYQWFGCVASRNVGDLRLDDSQPASRYPGLSQPAQTCLNPIVPLTQTRRPLLSAIDGLVVNVGGYRPETYIPGGLVWGVNVLSPSAPFTEGRAYAGNVRKIIVLMTDGENTLRYRDSDGHHVGPSGSGARAGELGRTNRDVGALCDYAKGRDMEIYTVGLGVSSGDARDLLADCATSGGHAFNADDSATLIAAFRQIARSIHAVRLVE